MRKTDRATANRKAKQILPAMLAVGGACSLFAGTAAALELGDIKINSALGQPLRASIAYALNPNEQLFDFCIYLRPDPSMAGVPTVSRPKISVENGTIFLAGTTPILEPILSMHVSVDCPYTANLAREYTLMINPAVAEPAVAPLTELPAPTPEPAQLAQFAPQAVVEPTPAPATNNRPVASIDRAQAAKPTPVLPSEQPVSDDPVSEPVVTQPVGDPVQANSRYFVQPGDSLSSIARRIENRPIAMWPAVHAIFAANPQAFADGDMNQLTAAVWLDIPSFADGYVAADVPAAAYAESEYEYASEDPAAASADAYAGLDDTDVATETEQDFATSTSADDIVPAATAVAANVEPIDEPINEPINEQTVEPIVQPIAAPAAEPAVAQNADPVAASAPEPVADPVVDTAPAAIAAGNTIATSPLPQEDQTPIADDAAQDAAVDGNADVDDTAVLRPGDVVTNNTEVATSAPVVPVVSRAPVADDGYFGIPKWAVLAGGSALALLLAYFAFGRTVRERLAARKATPAAVADEIFDDEDTAESTIIDDVDFQFEDNTVSSQSISLDADLGEGTGLQDSADLDVAQDFGFSSTATGEVESGIDLELPEEPPVVAEPSPTDIIEPSHRIEEAFVAIETPAAEDTQKSQTIADDGSEYDLSMIVDATKQPLGEEELTARDLMAVRADEDDAANDAANDLAGQTLASEVDIAILEQDYEDEFTQTQALNDEIARAAEELALRMHEDEETAEVTSRLETLDDPAMTATVQAPVEAGNDDLTEIADFNEPEDATVISDLDDTNIGEQLTANLLHPGNDPTVEMPPPGSEKTVAMPRPGSEATVDMPVPGNDPTVEMANPGNDPTVEMPRESGNVDSNK